MRIKNYIGLLLLAFITTQCAKQTAPTGGPKDEEPPILIRSTPKDQQTSFKGKEIELEFDEPIQLNNPREQLIITPAIGTFGKDFEILAKKNKVILTIKSKLQDNTTYSLNFRESIADLNEKNSKPLKLAISTGEYIDSLFIKGTVKDLLTEKPANNYTVAVVPQSDTFDIFKHNAVFFTFTNKEGTYSIENLKAGNYILYAFDDKNKNLKVDSRTEPYGFIAQTIQLSDSIENKNINTFKLDAAILKLISARDMFGLYTIKTSKSLVKHSVESTDDNQLVIAQQDKDLSTIKVYNTLQNIDSLLVKFTASDSIENTLDTLLYVKFSQKESTKEKFQTSPKSITYSTETKELYASLIFSKPVLKLLTDSLYINIDSATTIHFSEKELQWNNNRTELTISKKIEELSPTIKPRTSRTQKPEEEIKKEAKTYNKLILSKGAIISIETDTLAQTELEIKTIKPVDVGIISYKISTKEKFIIQLLDKDFKVVLENKTKETSSFHNLMPGTYYLRVVIDKNNNGKWDPGNFKSRKEPEEIIYYKNSKDQLEINIKANWEVGPLLINL